MTSDRAQQSSGDDHVRMLVVCTGNICRSTMAEAVMRDRLPKAGIDAVVDSAGISDEEQGRGPDPRAVDTLTAAGYPVHDHVATQVTEDQLRGQDLILAMTTTHARALDRLLDRYNLDIPLRLWREYDADARRSGGEGGPETDVLGASDLDVPDPWYGGPEDFVETLEVVERGIDGLIGAINAGDVTQPQLGQ